MVEDDVGHVREVVVQDLDNLLRLHPLAERSEAADVGEHDAYFLIDAAEPHAFRVLRHHLHDFGRQESLQGGALSYLLRNLLMRIESIDGCACLRSYESKDIPFVLSKGLRLLEIVDVQNAEEFSAAQQRSAHCRTKTGNAHAFTTTKTLIGSDVRDQNGLLLGANPIQDRPAENDVRLAGASRLWPTISNFSLSRDFAAVVKQHHESAFDSLNAKRKGHDLLRDAV